MHTKALLALAFASGLAFAQDIDQDDYPAECSDSCGPVADASDRCDRQFNDDDEGELNCLCTTANMETLVPQCWSCAQQYQNSDDEDDASDGKLTKLTYFPIKIHC